MEAFLWCKWNVTQKRDYSVRLTTIYGEIAWKRRIKVSVSLKFFSLSYFRLQVFEGENIKSVVDSVTKGCNVIAMEHTQLMNKLNRTLGNPLSWLGLSCCVTLCKIPRVRISRCQRLSTQGCCFFFFFSSLLKSFIRLISKLIIGKSRLGCFY